MNEPDTMEDIKNSDLVQLSRSLLTAVVQSTNILGVTEMTPVKLQESKMVLGFLNAADKTMRTKMSYFKMVGMEEKIAAVKEQSKNL